MDNLRIFSDGEYLFSVDEDNNQFYLYRKDGQAISNYKNIAMEAYQNYMCMIAFQQGCDVEIKNIRFDISDDNKVVRLTTFNLGEKDPLEEENGFQKFIKSIFKRKKRKDS